MSRHSGKWTYIFKLLWDSLKYIHSQRNQLKYCAWNCMFSKYKQLREDCLHIIIIKCQSHVQQRWVIRYYDMLLLVNNSGRILSWLWIFKLHQLGPYFFFILISILKNRIVKNIKNCPFCFLKYSPNLIPLTDIVAKWTQSYACMVS